MPPEDLTIISESDKNRTNRTYSTDMDAAIQWFLDESIQMFYFLDESKTKVRRHLFKILPIIVTIIENRNNNLIVLSLKRTTPQNYRPTTFLPLLCKTLIPTNHCKEVVCPPGLKKFNRI